MNRTSTISSIFLACILSFVCHAAPSEADWKNFNHATVNSFVIPFYQSLSAASQALQQSTQGLCQSPSQEALDNSIGDFHKTMDAWQSIQNITFGPIEFSMRSHSLQFWPDKKNHIGKHLGVLLASDDKTLLNEDKFQ
ncbi:imelysin family protein, partial [Oleiphilus sp. HI0123]